MVECLRVSHLHKGNSIKLPTIHLDTATKRQNSFLLHHAITLSQQWYGGRVESQLFSDEAADGAAPPFQDVLVNLTRDCFFFSSPEGSHSLRYDIKSSITADGREKKNRKEKKKTLVSSVIQMNSSRVNADQASPKSNHTLRGNISCISPC